MNEGASMTTSLRELPEKWRAEAARLRLLAGKAARRGDLTDQEIRLGYAQDAEAYADELEAALSTPPADDVLPCDVIVAPATRILAGCKVSTLMRCIETRRAAMIAATEGSNG